MPLSRSTSATAADQRSRCSCASKPHQHADRASSPGTSRRRAWCACTCPAITACVTPASFSTLMHFPSWPSEIQWSAAAGGRAASSASSGNVSSLSGDDRDVVPRAARGVEHEEGKAAVSGDQAKAHDKAALQSAIRRRRLLRRARDGRRRMTPRCEVRMKSTRYWTSAQASERSCSICCSARVVFSFDCSR